MWAWITFFALNGCIAGAIIFERVFPGTPPHIAIYEGAMIGAFVGAFAYQNFGRRRQ